MLAVRCFKLLKGKLIICALFKGFFKDSKPLNKKYDSNADD